jgi:hypothetical protein
MTRTKRTNSNQPTIEESWLTWIWITWRTSGMSTPKVTMTTTMMMMMTQVHTSQLKMGWSHWRHRMMLTPISIVRPAKARMPPMVNKIRISIKAISLLASSRGLPSVRKSSLRRAIGPMITRMRTSQLEICPTRMRATLIGTVNSRMIVSCHPILPIEPGSSTLKATLR